MADYCSEHKMPVSFLSKENNQVFFYVSAKNTGIWSYNWLDQWTIGTRHNYRSQKKACATLTFFFFFFRCTGYPPDVSGYLEAGQALQCKRYPLDVSGYLEAGQALQCTRNPLDVSGYLEAGKAPQCKGYPLDVSGYLETGQALQCKGYPLDGSGYLETGQALHQLHLLHLSDDEGLLDALQLSPAV